jgi:hypothetical protein
MAWMDTDYRPGRNPDATSGEWRVEPCADQAHLHNARYRRSTEANPGYAFAPVLAERSHPLEKRHSTSLVEP